ncbi:MAG TPA: DUF4129 domain-containing protein, partial [Mycobacterium sp.]|uniref:DUF4129 domain-containing protein n=1 Tax=Mycobacterium sp. TaxID=1785 RepID=UPI002F424F33
SVSLVIVAVAVITRLRDPRRAPASANPLPKRFFDGRGRPAWRVLIIGGAVLVAWLVLVWVLAHFVVPHGVDQPPSAPRSAASPPPGDASRPPGPQDTGADRDVLRYLIVSTLVLLALIVVGAIGARRRRVPAPPMPAARPLSEPAATAATTSLVRAAESGLAAIEDPDHEPRQAIIACYAAMERELRHFPAAVPQEFDTPTEVLARAVEHHTLHVDNAAELVNLFEEARFSPHVMTEAHRSSALRVLQLVLADMRSSV